MIEMLSKMCKDTAEARVVLNWHQNGLLNSDKKKKTVPTADSQVSVYVKGKS